jgi:hypothetical protein
MEDLKDAINQVVLLQNVRGTLMDEIAQLKGTITTQSDELAQAHAATQVPPITRPGIALTPPRSQCAGWESSAGL